MWLGTGAKCRWFLYCNWTPISTCTSEHKAESWWFAEFIYASLCLCTSKCLLPIFLFSPLPSLFLPCFTCINIDYWLALCRCYFTTGFKRYLCCTGKARDASETSRRFLPLPTYTRNYLLFTGFLIWRSCVLMWLQTTTRNFICKTYMIYTHSVSWSTSLTQTLV
jgi:hypothetical protein